VVVTRLKYIDRKVKLLRTPSAAKHSSLHSRAVSWGARLLANADETDEVRSRRLVQAARATFADVDVSDTGRSRPRGVQAR
jgi:hypothetical protein